MPLGHSRWNSLHNVMPYRHQLTIPSGSVQEDLPKFPLSVRVTINPAHTTGTFTFRDHTLAVLPSDLVSYDPVAGKVNAVVKTTLSSTADTKIYLYLS